MEAQLQRMAGTIREEMAKQGISTYKLSNLTGQKRSTVEKIINGKTVNVASLLKVAQVLSLEIHLKKSV